jgi:putative ABC transport system permease protein
VTGVAALVAVYRALARLLLPAPFRRRFGADMTQVLRVWARDAVAAGGAPALGRVAAIALADLARTAAREHVSELAEARARRRQSRRARRHPPADHRTPDPGDSMGSLLQDVRYGLRTVRRSPALALVVIASLALGIGANSLIFSVVDGVVYHPFVFPEPDRLVAVGATFPKVSGQRGFIETFSPPEYLEIKAQSKTLDRVFAMDLGNRNISGGDRPERVFTAFVWGSPFEAVGMRPFLGRGFRMEETDRQGAAVAILSHRVWQSRFGSDSSLVGRTIQMNGRAVTVVGIMPPGLLLLGTDLWLPMGVSPTVIPRNARQFTIVGRLAAGASLAAANTELATIARRIENANVREREEYTSWRVEVVPFATALVGQYRPAAAVLLGAVGLVLLIACANIASLLLARAATRQRELAVRRALGAGRLRIARQLLTESLVLSLAGGAVGLAIAYGLVGPTAALFPSEIASAGVQAAINGRVVGYTFVLAMLAGLTFGVAPAVQGARAKGGASLAAEGVRLTVSAAGRRLRHLFVVVELALALMLLAGAGLLIRSFARLQGVDAGFDARRVLTMRLSLPREKYRNDAVAPFFEQLATRVEGLPGVRAAGAGTQFPPGNMFTTRVGLEGDRATSGEMIRTADVTNTTTGFFRAMGYALKAGRDFGSGDVLNAPLVAVVNETAARRFFPGQSAVGRRIRLGDDASTPWTEIVGVVGDVRNHGLDAPTAPEVFVPVSQQVAGWNNQLFLLVRATGDPAALLPAVRKAVAAIDADQPVYLIATLEQAFARSVSQRRIAMVLVTIFAGVALVLAAVGIYGIMSYMVNERTHEIGIRMALGARRADVVMMVVRETLRLVAIGLVLGLGGALALGRAMSSLVFGIGTSDPATLAAVALVLGIVAVIASLIPARRATGVAPVEALRT